MVDLNCDVGEGYPDDDALLALVTSANVACGFHAGDAETMRRITATCAERNVAVGAQVSYRDREGFGRRRLDVAPDVLRADVAEQIGALLAIARDTGTRVRYVKPHGALYHACSTDEEHARAVIDAIADCSVTLGGSLLVLAQAGSRFAATAERCGLVVVSEAFADRGYRDDGTLVPRDEPGALLTDPGQAADQALAIAVDHRVTTAAGRRLPVDAASICVHGDTPGALAVARAVRTTLETAGVHVAPFGVS